MLFKIPRSLKFLISDLENFGPPKKYKSKFSLNFLYFDRALKIKYEFLYPPLFPRIKNNLFLF